jgi:hypothetical protein
MRACVRVCVCVCVWKIGCSWAPCTEAKTSEMGERSTSKSPSARSDRISTNTLRTSASGTIAAYAPAMSKSHWKNSLFATGAAAQHDEIIQQRTPLHSVSNQGSVINKPTFGVGARLGCRTRTRDKRHVSVYLLYPYTTLILCI